MRAVRVFEPTREQVLEFCARDPVERVFLQDVAQRRLARFLAVGGPGGELAGLCHLGANVVPSGQGCAAFADAASRREPRMIIGEEGAVGELWDAARRRLSEPREDRPGQPVFVIREPPEPGGTELRAATRRDLDLLLPACAEMHRAEVGVDPLRRDADGFRWRTSVQIDEGRSWLWVDDLGRILFKAEASAWTSSAVQLQQVWVDPEVRGLGFGRRGLRDLCRILLERVPAVCLFVRSDNVAAIRMYEGVGMRRTISYRSLIF